MVNYQGVRRIKKYLMKEYGLDSKSFRAHSYKRYSGYEAIHFLDSNNVLNRVVIQAFSFDFWIRFEKYDDDTFSWIDCGVSRHPLSDLDDDFEKKFVSDLEMGELYYCSSFGDEIVKCVYLESNLVTFRGVESGFGLTVNKSDVDCIKAVLK